MQEELERLRIVCGFSVLSSDGRTLVLRVTPSNAKAYTMTLETDVELDRVYSITVCWLLSCFVAIFSLCLQR